MPKEVLLRGGVVVSVPPDVDVRSVRARLGMTQNLFAARFGFPLATLRHWEHGRRKPTGASLTLLNVIARNPRAVLQALRPPQEVRPINELVAVWDASEARDREEQCAAMNDLEDDRLARKEATEREGALAALERQFSKK